MFASDLVGRSLFCFQRNLWLRDFRSVPLAPMKNGGLAVKMVIDESSEFTLTVGLANVKRLTGLAGGVKYVSVDSV